MKPWFISIGVLVVAIVVASLLLDLAMPYEQLQAARTLSEYQQMESRNELREFVDLLVVAGCAVLATVVYHRASRGLREDAEHGRNVRRREMRERLDR